MALHLLDLAKLRVNDAVGQLPHLRVPNFRPLAGHLAQICS
jgi:hypothetical protein